MEGSVGEDREQARPLVLAFLPRSNKTLRSGLFSSSLEIRKLSSQYLAQGSKVSFPTSEQVRGHCHCLAPSVASFPWWHASALGSSHDGAPRCGSEMEVPCDTLPCLTFWVREMGPDVSAGHQPSWDFIYCFTHIPGVSGLPEKESIILQCLWCLLTARGSPRERQLHLYKMEVGCGFGNSGENFQQECFGLQKYCLCISLRWWGDRVRKESCL